MSKVRLSLELPEESVRCLEQLPGGAAAALNELVASVVEGMSDPAGWQRDWLERVFAARAWVDRLEPDPMAPGRLRPRAPDDASDWPSDEATVPMRGRTPER